MVQISVVMPVFNTPVPILKEAVDSILNQTFRDFEFIIIDDGSEGETATYLLALSDPRIKLLRNKENIGITKSLNIGFAAAQGKYIARMDSDDYSYPERFQRQFDFMESHPDVIVCGSRRNNHVKKSNMEQYRIKMLFMNPGPLHPSAFFNHEKINQYHLKYDESLPYAQDYALWAEIVQYGEVYIFPEKLVDYRGSARQISRSHRDDQIQCDKTTQKKLLFQLLDYVTDEELDLHYQYSHQMYQNVKISREARNWYHRLIKANDKKRIYGKLKFKWYIYRIVLIQRFPCMQYLRNWVGIRIINFRKRIRLFMRKMYNKEPFYNNINLLKKLINKTHNKK